MMSGDDADAIPLALLRFSSSCFIPGNGKSLELSYLCRSAGETGGTGDIGVSWIPCGDNESAEAEGECPNDCEV